MTRRALIVGVTGQDGAYLAKHLLANDYEVHGTGASIDSVARAHNLHRLGIAAKVKAHPLRLPDEEAVRAILREVQPSEVYGLAGPSSVGASFRDPHGTCEALVRGAVELLLAVRDEAPRARVYTASSSEMFGDLGDRAANETTPMRAISPYGRAKAVGHVLTRHARTAWGLFASSGILFNHESPLRPDGFVTSKIVAAACRIADGDRRPLILGDLTIRRDWGWAPEYVEAMHAILQHDEPDDFVIATGESHSLDEFVGLVFEAAGLDARDHVETDPRLFRPQEIRANRGDPAKAERRLGWKARTGLAVVAQRLVEARRRS